MWGPIPGIDDRTDAANADDRSVTPVIGLVLLFGIVLVGAAILAVAGLTLVDALSSESQAERAQSAISLTDHGIATAIMSGDSEEIPWDDATYRDDGEMYLVWFDNSTGTMRDETKVHVDRLGAIEYELDDRTIAYQGGGTFVKQDGDTHVTSSPNVHYDGESLQVRIVTLTEGDLDGGDTTASPQPNSEYAKQMDWARENASSNENDLGLVITGDYHEGWEAHLEESLAENNVEVGSDLGVGLPNQGQANTVQVLIENVTVAEPEFKIVFDEGLAGDDEHANSNRFVDGGDLEFEVEVENTASEEKTGYVNVTLEGVDVSGSNETTIEAGETEMVTISIPENEYDDELTFGETYEYRFSTEEHHGHSGAEFYYAKQDDPYLEFSNPTVDGVDATDSENPVNATQGKVTIEVDLQNLGASNASAGEIELELDVPAYPNENWYDPDVQSVDVGYGEERTVTWEMNRSKLLEAEHEFTVSAVEDGTAATGYFDVEQGIDVSETELYLDPDTEVTVSFIGSELSSHCDGGWVCGYSYNRWLPTFVDIYTQPVDENNEPVGDPERHDESDGVYFADRNINKHDDRLEIFEYSFVAEERVSLMLQATSYLDCSDWEHQETIDGIAIEDCATGSEFNQHVDLTAETDTEESNVRVLNETRNTMPELEPGVEVQMRADELLQREEVDIEVTENEDEDVYDGEGYDLHLDENEFVFLFEITHHPEQYNLGPELSPDPEENPNYWTNERYWQEAFDRQGGDPNFNDVIAHVEIEPTGEPEYTEIDGAFDAGDGNPVSVSPEDPDDGQYTDDGDIDVGNDEIIIG